MKTKESPRKNMPTPLGFRIPKWLHEYLKEQADKKMLSVSDIVRHLIIKDYEEKKSRPNGGGKS